MIMRVQPIYRSLALKLASNSSVVRCATLVLAAATLAGCHSRKGDMPEPGVTKMLAPQAPPFPAGPMGPLLTNSGGFSARLVAEIPLGPGGERPVAGHLLCLGSKLVFAPEREQVPEKKAPRGGFAFIWDVAQGRGFLVSDALQGYAELTAHSMPTNIIAKPTSPAGKGRGTEEVTVQMSDGFNAFFQIQRSSEAHRMPVRLSAANNTEPITVTLSKFRLTPPTPDLFAPPAGFTKYSSPEALVDELAIRHRNMKRKPEEPALDAPPNEGQPR
jgi:hypothetical protein